MRRLRIASVEIRPVLVWDDGDTLSPGPDTNPTRIGFGDLPFLADRLRAEVEQVQAEVEAQEPPTDPVEPRPAD